MKIWIYLDGRQQGPYRLEELKDLPVYEETKVWFAGLPKWYPAGVLPELKPYIRRAGAEEGSGDAGIGIIAQEGESVRHEWEKEEVEISEETEDTNENEATDAQDTTLAPGQPEQADQPVASAPVCPPPAPVMPPFAACEAEEVPPLEGCPPNRLIWAILTTVVLCSPIALIGIFTAVKVNSSWREGNTREAHKYSEITGWLIIVSWALGWLPGLMLFGSL